MLNQAVGYAASALGYVANTKGRTALVKEIAEACGIPSPYLAKIIHSLSKSGIVTTQRGIGGGVTLARPAEQLTLWELCQAMNDPIIHARCMLGTAQCSDERACPAHAFWKEHRAQHMEFLMRTTIADVAAFEMSRRQ
ncbi:MAG: Rrf2 family transcriptional regulator [Phycisphaerales bacterium]